ncbi:MAG: arabinose transporter permease, partial [Clostridia bacterium]|nr:arabinose transporter permease [Clostridia bacterium]
MKRRLHARKTALTVLATGLMVLWACIAMLPFAFMFLSSLKPGQEMLRKGLSLTFDPGISSFKNYEALNTYRDG